MVQYKLGKDHVFELRTLVAVVTRLVTIMASDVCMYFTICARGGTCPFSKLSEREIPNSEPVTPESIETIGFVGGGTSLLE